MILQYFLADNLMKLTHYDKEQQSTDKEESVLKRSKNSAPLSQLYEVKQQHCGTMHQR